MGQVRKLAEKLFRDEHPNPFPYSPYGSVPRFSDLWEQDQERYIRRAEQILLKPTCK